MLDRPQTEFQQNFPDFCRDLQEEVEAASAECLRARTCPCVKCGIVELLERTRTAAVGAAILTTNDDHVALERLKEMAEELGSLVQERMAALLSRQSPSSPPARKGHAPRRPRRRRHDR